MTELDDAEASRLTGMVSLADGARLVAIILELVPMVLVAVSLAVIVTNVDTVANKVVVSSSSDAEPVGLGEPVAVGKFCAPIEPSVMVRVIT